MKTDALLAALAADAAPGPRLSRRIALRLAPALALALIGIVAFVALTLGMRPDVPGNLVTATAAKTLLPLAVAVACLAVVLRLSRPAAVLPRRSGLAGAGLAGVAAALALWGLATTAPADWLAAATGASIPVCLLMIPALSLLPLAALLLALREGASTDPARSGLWAGLAAGGVAAAAYSLHCTEDSPLFYLPWYGLGILLSARLGRLAGQRFLRW